MRNKFRYSWIDFDRDVRLLLTAIRRAPVVYESVYGVPRGGVPLALALSSGLGLPMEEGPPNNNKCLVCDDIVDSGKTRVRFSDNDFACLHIRSGSDASCYRAQTTDDWIVYPWEEESIGGPTDSIVRMLEYIGEDPKREGLLKTPERVVKAWDSLFSGYGKDPKDAITHFDGRTYDQIVLLKDVEMYSMCEHHLLPFYGKAHIAYIPKGRVIGVSKLARLLEIFSRRLQIQERICEEVTQALMECLDPVGAACIIEAKHLCMMARGVEKQNSIMVTSSLKGVFLFNLRARDELMLLLK